MSRPARQRAAYEARRKADEKFIADFRDEAPEHWFVQNLIERLAKAHKRERSLSHSNAILDAKRECPRCEKYRIRRLAEGPESLARTADRDQVVALIRHMEEFEDVVGFRQISQHAWNRYQDIAARCACGRVIGPKAHMRCRVGPFTCCSACTVKRRNIRR